MPLLTLLPRDTCILCGCRLRGFMVGTYRINKNSMKSAHGGLGFMECPECGPIRSRRNPIGVLAPVDRWRPDAKSQAVIDESRARKGWT